MQFDEINKKISDRSEVFYWQTDRKIDPLDAASVWSDRHSSFNDHELVTAINIELSDSKVEFLFEFEKSSHLTLGNINSVRHAILDNGKEVIIRCHPKGIVNGYFYSESLAAQKLLDMGLPSYETFAIGDSSKHGFSFQVIEKLDGIPVQTHLDQRPDDERKLVIEAGKTMAKMHQLTVDGFGPFSNELAQNSQLQGLHDSFENAVLASLEFNLKTLVEHSIINFVQSRKITELFISNDLLQSVNTSTFVHNDFADWNMLTDGNSITGIIDLDECVGGHPVSDIACWSTFFDPQRVEIFEQGYFQISQHIDNYKDIFELLRLRYILSKMTLRIRKSSWDISDFLKEKIRIGALHMTDSLRFFNI